MTIIIVIGVILGVGAVFLMRSSPAPAAPAVTDADAALLREEVLARLRERLVGWTFEAPVERPFELTAVESATERRIQMNLQRLGETWFPFHARQQKEEAAAQIDAFILGATGQGEGSDEEELDHEGLRDVLALRLMAPGKLPPGALSRPAGELVAVLVMRNIGGHDTVNAASLEAMKLSEGEAFQLAFENLARDVEEGLELEILDDADPPGIIAIAPKDPLASAYALVPALAERVRRKMGGREGHLFLDENSLVAALDGTQLDREKPLLADAQPLNGLAWSHPPA